ncbi:hypothetical protein DV737_g5745, partial [Chaetothyriales sp. CBS 132003]
MLEKSLPAIPPPEPRAAASPTPYGQNHGHGQNHSHDHSPSAAVEGPSLSKAVSELRDRDRDRDADAAAASPPPGDTLTLTLPSTAFAAAKRRSFAASQHSDDGSTTAADEYLVPVAFDPSPPTVHSAPLVDAAAASAKASPHIAYQDKRRPDASRSRSGSGSPFRAADRSRHVPDSAPSPANFESPRPPQHPQILAHLPKRGDSLDGARRPQAATAGQTIPRKELSASASAAIPASLSDPASAPIESPRSHSIFSTPDMAHDSVKSDAVKSDAVKSGANTLQSQVLRAGDLQISPSLPRYSAGADFAMDEEMARILGGSDTATQHGSFLRRVSNSVRHGRSYSDKPSGRLSRDRWPRSPGANTSLVPEISSPTSASPESKEELAWFRNELRRERQKLIEREKRIAELEAQLDSTAEMKLVNSELREKRSTMVVLDTQKEIVVRELEVLTDHIAAAKASKEPFDAAKLTGTVLRDFAQSLDRLKNSFAPQIEDFIQRRNDLIDEIASLTQMKDKSLLEFEQLSSKNAQLAELNNQLVHQIQGLYKANSGASAELPPPRSGAGAGAGAASAVNGLGIYAHKERSNLSVDSAAIRNAAADLAALDSATTLTAGEAESVALFQGPHVVNIRKGGQPKKFDWRKGQKVAKGVTKGLKGAFSSAQQSYGREMQFAETGAYGQQPAGQEPNQKGGANAKPNGLYAAQVNQANTSTPSLHLDPTTHLFGVDLEQRAEYEKTNVPEIVRRMDVEGIYRKSGGNSQVQQVRDSFERDVYSADISDPDLDIHAVTSGLKQYFRKLPNPLITYDIYDKLLETTSVADPVARVEAMRDAVRQLPPVHYATLDFLMNHLARVVLQEKDNLMTSMNIAVVFAPTIMRPESITRELGDTKAKNDCCMWIVDHNER